MKVNGKSYEVHRLRSKKGAKRVLVSCLKCGKEFCSLCKKTNPPCDSANQSAPAVKEYSMIGIGLEPIR